MTALPVVDALAFHLGFVVTDVDTTLEQYSRLLPNAHSHTTDFPLVRLAFLRAAGVTFEFIQPRTPDSVYAAYLQRHGEGVHHIGFWVPDVRAAVTAAVAQGARVTQAVLDGDGRGAVAVQSGAVPPGLLERISSGGYTYLDVGVGVVEFEFVGPMSEEWLHRMLGADYERLVSPPPWRVRPSSSDEPPARHT